MVYDLGSLDGRSCKVELRLDDYASDGFPRGAVYLREAAQLEVEARRSGADACRAYFRRVGQDPDAKPLC